MMRTYGIAYAGTLRSFLLIDAIWLGVVAKNFYRDQLGELMLRHRTSLSLPSSISSSQRP